VCVADCLGCCITSLHMPLFAKEHFSHVHLTCMRWLFAAAPRCRAALMPAP
jgi:hypothetical protein